MRTAYARITGYKSGGTHSCRLIVPAPDGMWEDGPLGPDGEETATEHNGRVVPLGTRVALHRDHPDHGWRFQHATPSEFTP